MRYTRDVIEKASETAGYGLLEVFWGHDTFPPPGTSDKMKCQSVPKQVVEDAE